jgi:hypothetical protein
MSGIILADILATREGLTAAPGRISAEIEGLTEDQMTFARDEPVWARWSVEMQLRHMALLSCRWIARLREPLEEKGYAVPEVDSGEVMSGNGRQIPASICPDTKSVLEFIGAHCVLGAEILGRESPEFLRATAGERVVDPEAHYSDSPGQPIDFARMAAALHPFGWEEISGRPGHFRVEAVAALRQIHWEILAHLRTVQRIKGLLGLPEKITLPHEGYLADPKFFG